MSLVGKIHKLEGKWKSCFEQQTAKWKSWWLWKVHLSTRVVFDKIYLIPDIRRHPHLVPCHFVLTSEVIAHRLYLDMLFHFLSLKTTLKKRQIFSISAAPEERNFFDQISLTKDNPSHKQFLTSETIDFKEKHCQRHYGPRRRLL